jgi:NhaC family Na+:H+ antiporter
MANVSSQHRPTSLRQAAIPVLGLLVTITYGLIVRPRLLGLDAIPLEIVFVIAASVAILHLSLMGFSWIEIQESIVKKLSKGLPMILILFAIGLIIGSWIISGTIPMLVYYGIKFINPTYLYLLAFLVPAIFSSFTGTSWGSVGTIGIVIIGVAGAVNAHLGITAGAIIAGAFFGDKLSPLSDTTNIAAIATEVPLYDHIQSMMYTTVPSAILAMSSFFLLGFIYPITDAGQDFVSVNQTLLAIGGMFTFNPLLLLPPCYVLYASIRRKATLPTLVIASAMAIVLALAFQSFSLSALIQTLYKGFSHTMYHGPHSIPENVQRLFDRGGLYELNEPIIISIMVFIFIGAIDRISAMPIIVDRLFSFAKKKSTIILSSLFSSALTNAMTSNQFATSFVVGDAFKSKYDEFNIPRKVLSRSIEDYGTMIESLIPWTTTTIFMSATLGVPFAEYWHWQLLSLFNLIVAPSLAILGIGCFYPKGETR